MNKLRTIFLFGLVLLCFAAAAQAELVNVSSQLPSATFSSSLGAGVEYLFTVSGLYSYDWSGHYADAEFSSYQGVWDEYYYGIPTATDTLDLVVDGSFVDWLGSADGVNYTPHTYSPDTVYRCYYIGMGWPASFYIYDASRYDNAGMLTVDIEEVPEPSGLAALLAGCAGLLSASLRKRAKKR
jgi:hypothetical protein